MPIRTKPSNTIQKPTSALGGRIPGGPMKPSPMKPSVRPKPPMVPRKK